MDCMAIVSRRRVVGGALALAALPFQSFLADPLPMEPALNSYLPTFPYFSHRARAMWEIGENSDATVHSGDSTVGVGRTGRRNQLQARAGKSSRRPHGLAAW